MTTPHPSTLAYAVELVVSTQHGSITMLQRRMGLDLNGAGILLDHLEKYGIVGPFTPDKPTREVLVGPAEEGDALKAVAAGRRYEPLSAAAQVAQTLVKAQLPVDMLTTKPDGLDTAKVVDDVARRVVETFIGAGWRPTRT